MIPATHSPAAPTIVPDGKSRIKAHTLADSKMIVQDEETEEWLRNLATDKPCGLDDQIEDAYSIRATPQVMGPVVDTTQFVQQTRRDGNQFIERQSADGRRGKRGRAQCQFSRPVYFQRHGSTGDRAGQYVQSFGPAQQSPAASQRHDMVREYVPYLDRDEPLTDHIEKIASMFTSGEFLDAVPQEVEAYNW